MMYRHNGVLYAPVSSFETAAGRFFEFESSTFGHRTMHETNRLLVPDPVESRVVARGQAKVDVDPIPGVIVPQAPGTLPMRGFAWKPRGLAMYPGSRFDLIAAPLWANKVIGIPEDRHIYTPFTAPVSLAGWHAFILQQEESIYRKED